MTTAPQAAQGDRQWKTRLARAAARRARVDAEFYVTVAEIGGSVPQTQIATVLHTTQSNVSRWADRGREQAAQAPPRAELGGRTRWPKRYAAGQITREQMLDAGVPAPRRDVHRQRRIVVSVTTTDEQADAHRDRLTALCAHDGPVTQPARQHQQPATSAAGPTVPRPPPAPGASGGRRTKAGQDER